MSLRPLEYVNDALFIGLAGACYIQWRRHGGKEPAWLALTFGLLAGVMAAATLALPSLPEPGDARPGWLAPYLAVVVAQWTTTSLIVVVRLWLAGGASRPPPGGGCAGSAWGRPGSAW